MFSSFGNYLGGLYNSAVSGISSAYNTVKNAITGGGVTQGAAAADIFGSPAYNTKSAVTGAQSSSGPGSPYYGTSAYGQTGSQTIIPNGVRTANAPVPNGSITPIPQGNNYAIPKNSAGIPIYSASNYSSPSYSANGLSASPTFSAPTSFSVGANSIGAGTPSVNMPSAPSPKSYLGTAVAGNVGTGADAATGMFNNGAGGTNADGTPKTATSDVQGETSKALKEYLASLKAPASEAESYNRAQQQSGLFQAQQQKQNTQNAINAVTTKMNTDLLQLRGTAAANGVTEAVYGGQQAQVSREATIKLLPLQAQLAADQGNLEMAQENTNNLFKIYADDAKNSVDFYNDSLKAAWDVFDEGQKQKLSDIAWQKGQNADMIKTDSSNQASIANELLKAGDMNGYRAITSIQVPSNVNSPSFAQDYANYKNDLSSAVSQYGGSIGALDRQYKQAQLEKLNAETAASGVPTITNPDAAQYSTALNIILGSSKFTKEQKSTVVGAINSGEDAFSVIKNQAKNIMGTNEQTTLTKYEVARDTLNDIGTQLQQFYDDGGKTNLIKGTIQQVAQKLGTVNDPKLANLATQIQGNLQVYRNAISGTAYSQQEGQDIASIFPGINKTESLNNAILSARSSLFDSVIDSTYRTVLGKSYDELKKAETTNSSPAQTIPKGVDGTSYGFPGYVSDGTQWVPK